METEEKNINSVIWVPTKVNKAFIRSLVKKCIEGDVESEAKLKFIIENDKNLLDFARKEYQKANSPHQKTGKRQKGKYSSVRFSDLHNSYQIRN